MYGRQAAEGGEGVDGKKGVGVGRCVCGGREVARGGHRGQNRFWLFLIQITLIYFSVCTETWTSRGEIGGGVSKFESMWVKELECGELVGRHWRGNGKGKEDSVTEEKRVRKKLSEVKRCRCDGRESQIELETILERRVQRATWALFGRDLCCYLCAWIAQAPGLRALSGGIDPKTEATATATIRAGAYEMPSNPGMMPCLLRRYPEVAPLPNY
ncbi:hypothetical protein M9H77_07646 [Catharanthus roseus]|uniref:Uncharacterized protein n=1 Tax=Catharanthus roseus TaxID=4058 RepID=A0ACC0BVK5_CATRO|nr:hypothetical protein M9H77_07646 [Catharanthus roseus]